MKSFHIFALLMLILLYACQQQTPSLNSANGLAHGRMQSDLADLKSDNFEQTCQNIISAINSKNYTVLNQYIHPTYGFYLLDNPGAFTYATHYFNADSLSETHYYILQTKFIRLKPMQEGKLPRYDCDTEWNKQGCFWQELEHYKGISSQCANYMPEYWDVPPTEEELKNAQWLESQTKRGIVSTEGEGFSFYLAQIDGKWYLTILDLITPCSA